MRMSQPLASQDVREQSSVAVVVNTAIVIVVYRTNEALDEPFLGCDRAFREWREC
jgi:hypothetical protein